MTEHDLTLVGLTEDRTNLVLVSASGQEFTLPVDASLRAALRGDQTRLGQLEIQMDSALRPRDIQARIRSGETPENVAVAAGTTVDRIMGYATPVLAERAHIADRAQRASVRRKAGDGPSRQLADAVAERLRSRNVDPSSVEWDSWRREDGRWTLVADYRSGESPRHAEFVFDAPGKYVVPEDDEARWLVGEKSSSKGPQPRTPGTRRLSAVVSDDEELPLGSDAIELVSDDPADDPAADDGADEETTVDLSGTAEAVREHDTDLDDAVDVVDAEDTADADPVPDADDDPVERPSPPRREVRKSRGRASVPSWDEIMFGGGKTD
jgi:hypothetical protein